MVLRRHSWAPIRSVQSRVAPSAPPNPLYFLLQEHQNRLATDAHHRGATIRLVGRLEGGWLRRAGAGAGAGSSLPFSSFFLPPEFDITGDHAPRKHPFPLATSPYDICIPKTIDCSVCLVLSCLTAIFLAGAPRHHHFYEHYRQHLSRRNSNSCAWPWRTTSRRFPHTTTTNNKTIPPPELLVVINLQLVDPVLACEQRRRSRVAPTTPSLP